jgi:hypothetical protein
VRLPEQDPNLDLVIVKADTVWLIYKGGAKKPSYSAGDVLLGVQADGYLRSVRSVSDHGDVLIVITDPACLTDAFEKLRIDTTFVLTPDSQTLGPMKLQGKLSGEYDDEYSFTLTTGSACVDPLIRGGFEIRIPDFRLMITTNGQLCVGLQIDTVVYSKTIEVNPIIDIDLSGFRHFRFVPDAYDSVKFLGIHLALERSFTADVDTPLFSIPLGTYPVPVLPGVFVPFTFRAGIYGGIRALLDLTSPAQTTSNVFLGSRTSFGAECRDNSWWLVWEKSSDGRADACFAGNSTLNADIEPFLDVRLETDICGVHGPYVHLSPYEYNQISYPPFSYDLGYGYSGGLAFEVRILSWSLVDFDYTLIGDRVSLCHPTVNGQPSTPSAPSGPASGQVGSSYNFTGTTTDPENDRIQYEFDWNDGTYSGWSSQVSSGTPVTMSKSWSAPGTYSVKVHAKDEHGAVSDWSSGHSITIGSPSNNPPNTPSAPSGPASGQVGSSYNFTGTTTDPENDRIQYEFDWNDGTYSGWSSLVSSGTPVTMSKSWSASGTYSVKVHAKDEHGAVSDWSSGHSITIGSPSNNPPNTPSTPSGPSSGQVNTNYSFSSSATDPDGDNVAIRFDWGNGTISNWSSFVGSGQTVTMSGAWPSGGTYYVKAQAKDANGATSGWSGGHQIVISGASNNPPNTPSPPSGPSSGQVNTNYSFSSSAIDPDGDNVAIRFDWGNGTISNWSSFVGSGQTVTMSYAWPSAGSYWVKAQAKDVNGATSGWSYKVQIIISGGNNPPNTPSTPSGPSSGQVNTNYSFSSSATDPDGDNVAIRFDWGNGTISNWSSFVGSGQTVTMSGAWPSGGTYYVKAQAKDANGATSGWSGGHQIVISSGGGGDWHCATASAGWSARTNHTTVVFDNKIWVLGGWSGSDCTNDVWYSTDGESWTEATSSAGWSARETHSSVVFDNKIWVLGGWNTISYSHNDVWYSTDGESWTEATDSAGWSRRENHASVVFDNKIWVLGGWGASGYKNDVWYSTDGANWTEATSSAGWSARYDHTAVVFDNKIWVLGGWEEGSYDDVWYSTDGVNWTQATASAGWSRRSDHTSVVSGGKIWVLGGHDGATFYNDVWCSSDGVNWTQATTSAGWSGRRGHASVVCGGKIWVLGGHVLQTNSDMNDVWYWP